ncbi:MAG: hypothetical protein ABL986_02185 [Vicinamibacterales bacterium]
MRQQQWFAVLLGVAVLGLVASAAEKPPADYQKAMKDLGAFTASIDKAVAAEDWDAIAMQAASAREAFVVAQKYWDGKNTDAKELAGTGTKQTQDLIAVAGQKSKEGAEFSVGEIKAVCANCHMAHRDAQPDGSFLIK